MEANWKKMSEIEEKQDNVSKDSNSEVKKEQIVNVKAMSISTMMQTAMMTREFEGLTKIKYYDEKGNGFDIWTSKECPFALQVGAYRRGYRESICFTTYAKELNQDRPIWKVSPITALENAAIGRCLRWAFPEVLAGIYTANELSKDTPIDYIENPIVSEKTKAMKESIIKEAIAEKEKKVVTGIEPSFFNEVFPTKCCEQQRATYKYLALDGKITDSKGKQWNGRKYLEMMSKFEKIKEEVRDKAKKALDLEMMEPPF